MVRALGLHPIGRRFESYILYMIELKKRRGGRYYGILRDECDGITLEQWEYVKQLMETAHERYNFTKLIFGTGGSTTDNEVIEELSKREYSRSIPQTESREAFGNDQEVQSNL